MKKIGLGWIILLSTSLLAQAQSPVELGIRGGATFTHGYTVIPAQTLSPGLALPRIRNSNNGIGVGYLGGLWIRKSFRRFFIQAELSYSSLVLKQKASIDRIDVAAAPEFGVTLPISVTPGTLFAQLNTTTVPNLNSVYIPLFIGKQGAENRWRIYGGPTLFFTHQAEADRTASGRVEPNSTINFPGLTLTNVSDRVDLTDEQQAGVLQVKNFNFGVEFGAGITLLKRLEVDLRYGLPVGGVFNDSGITGYIGYATLAVGYKLFNF
ncbi:outer membrane beta-barrel protein [Larkinella sp. VNQ87]|uniref:outer membrane beta-barrel protein n=1 Tax=Larkinella sp. VNQ87 TaxID=3400921 RepID=UPI003C112C40